MNGSKPWLFPSTLKEYCGKAEGAIDAFRKQRGMTVRSDMGKSGVVHVRLEVEGRGSPGRMGQIYQLNTEERAQWIQAVDRGSDRVLADISAAQEV